MSVKFPGETAKYRQARDALLAQEIELRRQMEGSPPPGPTCRRAERVVRSNPPARGGPRRAAAS
jgi:hypothetical protein